MEIKTYFRNSPSDFWDTLMEGGSFADVYASAWAGKEPYQFKVKVIEEDGAENAPQPLRRILASIRADYIKYLQQEGFSPQHIIQHLGITRQRYYQILDKFGLEKTERIPKQAIIALIQEGASKTEIASHFQGVSSEVVASIEKKLQCEQTTRELNLRKEQFKIAFWSHLTNKEINAKLDITEASGRGYASRLDTPFKGRNAEYVNRLLCAGVPIKEVAQRRGVSESTVLRNLEFYKKAEDRYSREIPRTYILSKLEEDFGPIEYIPENTLDEHENPSNYKDVFLGPPITFHLVDGKGVFRCYKSYIDKLKAHNIDYVPIWKTDDLSEKYLASTS